MGSVWLADHLALHTQVVVKFITEALAENKEAIARFEREAAAAAQVKSPHVVQILDHGVSDSGAPFMVMELLEGHDLATHIEKYGRVPLKDVAEIVAQLCRALSRAHERGIVHRDIKPQNIFLCDAGSGELFVKLLDFGIAKGATLEREKLDANTKTGTVVGSPYYMSPEQLVGAKDIDFRTDLWSVGVVAFEAMTGTRAFDGETMGALALRIHNEPPPNPSERCDAITPAVDAWFLHACARSAKDRFGTAKEMADALQAAVKGEGPRSLSASGSTGPVSNPMALANTVADAMPVITDSNALSYAGVERPGVRTKSSSTTRFALIGAVAAAASIGGFAIFKVVSSDRDAHVSPSSSLVIPASATVSVAPPLPATTVPLVTASAPAASSAPVAPATATTTHATTGKSHPKPPTSGTAGSRPAPTGNEDDIK